MGLAIALCCAALGAAAQDFSGKTVNEIRFDGLERVSDQVVRAKLESKTDAPFNQAAVSRDVRRLYELGFFNTVNAGVAEAAGKVVLTFTVQEKRVIEEVRIIGNKKIKDRAIRGALKMREGSSFVPEAYEDERKAVLGLYEAKGYANTTVDAVAENIGPSRVRLVYTITEGRKARIHSIEFVGNDALTDHRLRKIMKTKRSWWFFGGKYEEEKFEADLASIVDEYGNRGRLEAQVPKTDLVYTDDGKGINVTVYVEEGPEYKMDTLDVAQNTVFDDDEMMQVAKVKPGDVHNKGQVAKDVQSLQKDYQSSGYVDAVVTPQVTLNRDTKTTRVVYNISEGDLKYIREIRVTGNNVTKDEIVRRQMLLIPGERYDGAAVEQSKQRLDNSRFFESVRITLEQPTDKDSADMFNDMLVDVEEGKTGTFNFGAGYSTEDGIGGFGELRLTNFDIANWPTFSGGGQQLRLRINQAEHRDQYSISFTEPEFLGYPVSMGVDLFDESYEVTGGADYTEDQKGGQLRFGKALSPYVQATAGLLYQDTDISGIPWYANREIRSQVGSSTTFGPRFQIERNTLDNKYDPTKGSWHILALQAAGFGGDNEFAKLEQDSTWYKPIADGQKWVLSARARHGIMDSYGSTDDVPLQDRFYAGGTNTVRGYDNRDIGPKVREYQVLCAKWGDWFATGGNIRMIYNLEAKYKVTKDLRLYGFVDAGGVWGDAGDFDFGDFRYSAGLGLGFNVPMLGPIRVDYGFPLNPDDTQSSSGRLHLATGYKF